MSATTQPVRYPDVRSPRFMTKRAWWLVLLNLLVPGSAQVVAGDRRLGRFGLGTTIVFWVLALLAIVLAVGARGIALALVTNTIVLGVLVALAVFYAVVWLVLTLDTLRLVRFVNVAPGARGLVAALHGGPVEAWEPSLYLIDCNGPVPRLVETWRLPYPSYWVDVVRAADGFVLGDYFGLGFTIHGPGTALHCASRYRFRGSNAWTAGQVVEDRLYYPRLDGPAGLILPPRAPQVP